jgi:excisionase family DNA binding protein
MKDYFSIPQAAKICSVDRSTMHRWVTSNKIKSYSTPGGHKRILIEDLKEFLKDNKIPIEIPDIKNEQTKILIIDDDTDVQTLLKAMLSGIFIEIQVASDGFEAGIKLLEFKPDLVILDLSMPNIDGFEVCKTIKENPATSNIKILIMTGYGTKENHDKAISLGADAFLEKPSTRKEIINQIERLLK